MTTSAVAVLAGLLRGLEDAIRSRVRLKAMMVPMASFQLRGFNLDASTAGNSTTRQSRSESVNGALRFVARRQPRVEEMAALAIFELQNPQIAIELQLTVEVGIDLSLGDLRAVEMRGPLTLELARVEACGGGTKQSRGSVESVDLYENGPRIIVAVPDHDSRNARGRTAAQIGFGPDFSLESHGGELKGGPFRRNSAAGRSAYWIEARRCFWTVASRSLIRSAPETRPEGVRPCRASKSRMARTVS